MSLFKCCDCCGRSDLDDGVIINSDPLKIKIRGYDNNVYVVKIGFALCDERDSDRVDHFYKEIMPKSEGSMSEYYEDEEEPMIDIEAEFAKMQRSLHNPNPSICLDCKKMLFKLGVDYGNTNNPPMMGK